VACGRVSGPADGGLFILYIAIRCQLQPHLGPPLPKAERDAITWKELISLLRAGFLPFMIFFLMNGPCSSWAIPAWSKARLSARWPRWRQPSSRAG
jgi:hypothetical protein